jgi:hypothetical protein
MNNQTSLKNSKINIESNRIAFDAKLYYFYTHHQNI